MTCPAATGACSIAPDAGCLPLKTYASLPQFTGVTAQGYADHFTISWDTPVSYPDYSVVMFIRPRKGGPTMARQYEARDTGTMTSHLGLINSDFYELWGRVETADHFGDWVRMIVLIDAAWSTNSEIVMHLGEVVVHGSDVILIG